MNLDLLRKAVRLGNVSWKKHVLQRIVERNIAQDDILRGLSQGMIIREYTHDKPFVSALFLCFIENVPLHIVASFDEVEEEVHIITAYNPTLDKFEEDFKTRRN